MLKVTIPKPCHEDWAAMTPNEQGRHCGMCAKTVIDFTQMTDETIKLFFINKKEEKVCGRFKQEQLHRIKIELPQNILQLRMPLWKRFLTACLLVFSVSLFSCDTNVKGMMIIKGDTITNPQINKNIEDRTVGSAIVMDDSTKLQPVCNIIFGGIMAADIPPAIKGETELVISPDSAISIIPVSDLNLQQDTTPALPIKKQDTIPLQKKIPGDSTDCNTTIFY
jgi:hypothetical protein